MKKGFISLLMSCASCFLVTSCSGLDSIMNIFKKEEKTEENNNTPDIEIEDVDVTEEFFLESVSTTPKDRYFMNLSDDPLILSMSLKTATGVGIDNIEDYKKEFTWTNLNQDVIKLELVPNEKTLKASVTPLKVGNATINVKNTFNEKFNFDFEIKVIDIKSSDYIWRYDSDKSQVYYCPTCKTHYNFGKCNIVSSQNVSCPLGHKLYSKYKVSEKNQFYNPSYTLNEELHKVSGNVSGDGYPSGTAYLNEMEWQFIRSRADGNQELKLNAAASSESALKFGKGDADAENLTLKTTTNKKIKRITVETASANSLADFTIKFNDESKLSRKANKLYIDSARGKNTKIWTEQNEYIVEFDGDISGNIEFSWINPQFDETAYLADPYGYKGPGAIYVKTIIIEYKD